MKSFLNKINSDTKSGVFNAIAAYIMWGVAPLYFKLLQQINSTEILLHRIVWSSVFLLLLVVIMKKTPSLINIIKQPKLVLKLAFSASLLALNWFMFIWAINNDHLLDASLGYFINPLFSVALGVVFLNERLRRNQIIAVALAITGVMIQLVLLGELPLISFALAVTFGTYGLIRKKLQVDSFVGLLMESLLMLPVALIFWTFFLESDSANMFINDSGLNITLIMAGVVTTAPLLCFTAAAKRLTLSALGFFQYIGPSIMFVLATFYYNEALDSAKLITFLFIWAALAIFSIDSLKAIKLKRVKS